MKSRNLLEVPSKWDRKKRNFNWNLVPKRLQELSLAGTYHDSKVMPI